MSAPANMVKVYNLTDVATPNLDKQKMVNQHIVVGTRMSAPGEFVEVDDSPKLRTDCEFLVSIGALSIGATPPPYTAARLAQKANNTSPALVRHLDVAETKVAQDPPAPAPAPEPVVEEEVAVVPASPKPISTAPAHRGKNNR